jgi:hypothetical protein
MEDDMRFTLTSRRSARALAGVLLPIGLAILTAASAGAVELELVTANDFLTHNEVDDDLYSFAVGLTLRLGRYDVSFYENAFTDRANALRFDETWLRVGRPLTWNYNDFGTRNQHFRLGYRVGGGRSRAPVGGDL